MNTKQIWEDYDFAAEYCARLGKNGELGDWPPSLISSEAMHEIDSDIEAFEQRVRDFAYARAMLAVNAMDDERDEDPATY